jgi:transposase
MANTWRFAMTAGILLRDDFDGSALRRLARQSHNAGQTRRLLALAEIHGGGSRSDAARIGGVGVQIVRDWVVRFNAKGLDGLLNGKAPGAPSILDDSQRQVLRRAVEDGPIPAVHGVVRWRLIDLARWLFRGVSPRDLQANAQPGTAKHGFSQALGARRPGARRSSAGFCGDRRH